MTGNPPQLAAFLALAREHDALLYVDDAHGFGVVGERDRSETSPYGRRGNGVVRHLGEGYDHVVLTGRFLLDRGIYVTLAFYPGVAREEVGFRIQVTAANTDAQVGELLAGLDRLADVAPLRAAGS